MFYDNEFEGMSEEEYLAEYEFRSNPHLWKEHSSSDSGYVPYVFSLDQGFEYLDRLVTYLALNLSDYERAKAERLLRGATRDIRERKFGVHNEDDQNGGS